MRRYSRIERQEFLNTRQINTFAEPRSVRFRDDVETYALFYFYFFLIFFSGDECWRENDGARNHIWVCAFDADFLTVLPISRTFVGMYNRACLNLLALSWFIKT